MFNLIKMNLYRMTKAVSSWVILFVAMAIGVLDFAMLKITVDDPFHLGMAETAGFTSGMNWMVALQGVFFGTTLLIVIGVFVVIFSNAETKCGFDKNIIGITKSKWKHTLARWISAMIGVTVIMAVTFFVTVALSFIFMNSFTAGDLLQFAKILGIIYLFYAAFSAVFFFFTTAFRSSAGGVVASLVISLGVLNMIEMLIDLGFTKLFGQTRYVPSEFFLDGAYGHLSVDSANGTLLKLTLICVVYIVAALGFSMFLQQKRDVK